MAVKKYSYKSQGNLNISEHTKVREFASQKGNKLYTDTVLVDDTLLSMIEILIKKLNCSKYIVASGYRTPQHDKDVGGKGNGQHTKGKAVDACFYDKDEKIISAKIVCCVAQDLGFNGIANINTAYKYVHLDMGGRSKPYLGDEIKGTKSVTTDFRKYYGISDTEIAKYTGEVVDVKPKVSYFKKYTGSTVSIVSALNSIGAKSTYNYRAKIAKKNGIKLYVGTAKQNTQMLNLLKQGKLIKP